MILPLDFDVVPKEPSKERYGYIAGWGLLWDRCSVNNDGPQRNSYCQFPFEYQGKKHSSCIKQDNPSGMHTYFSQRIFVNRSISTRPEHALQQDGGMAQAEQDASAPYGRLRQDRVRRRQQDGDLLQSRQGQARMVWDVHQDSEKEGERILPPGRQAGMFPN